MGGEDLATIGPGYVGKIGEGSNLYHKMGS